MPATADEIQLDIANGTLLLVRRPPLATYTDDHPDAVAIRTAWSQVRDDVLRRESWNFATAWARPGASTTANLGPLAIRYPLPADCLRVRFVQDLGPDDWAIEEAGADGTAMVMVSNASSPLVCYTKRVTDATRWDAAFVQAFKTLLAAEIAPAVAGSFQIGQALDAKAEGRAKIAARADAREKAPTQISRDTSWLAARR